MPDGSDTRTGGPKQATDAPGGFRGWLRRRPGTVATVATVAATLATLWLVTTHTTGDDVGPATEPADGTTTTTPTTTGGGGGHVLIPDPRPGDGETRLRPGEPATVGSDAGWVILLGDHLAGERTVIIHWFPDAGQPRSLGVFPVADDRVDGGPGLRTVTGGFPTGTRPGPGTLVITGTTSGQSTTVPLTVTGP